MGAPAPAGALPLLEANRRLLVTLLASWPPCASAPLAPPAPASPLAACSSRGHAALDEFLSELSEEGLSFAAAASPPACCLEVPPADTASAPQRDASAASSTPAGTQSQQHVARRPQHVGGAHDLQRSLAAISPGLHLHTGPVTTFQLLQQLSGGSGGAASAAASTHPNVLPVLAAALLPPAAGDAATTATAGVPDSSKTDAWAAAAVLQPQPALTLADLLRFSSASLGGDMQRRFLLYQLLHALASLHARGVALGGLAAGQVGLAGPVWVQLAALPGACWQPPAPDVGSGTSRGAQPPGSWAPTAAPAPAPTAAAAAAAPCSGDAPLPPLRSLWSPRRDLPFLMDCWRRGSMSNLEYLLWLNQAAGRVAGDSLCHPLVPWVIDFTQQPQGLDGACHDAWG